MGENKESDKRQARKEKIDKRKGVLERLKRMRERECVHVYVYIPGTS